MKPFVRNLRRDRTPRYNSVVHSVSGFNGIDAESEESSLSMDYCSYGYNLRFANGAMLNGFGFEYAKVPTRIPYRNGDTLFQLPDMQSITRTIYNMCLFRGGIATNGTINDRLIMACNDRRIHTLALSDGARGMIDVDIGQPRDIDFLDVIVNGQDRVLVAAPTRGLFLCDGTSLTPVAGAPRVSSPCKHYERIFATDGVDTLHFSALLNPLDWNVRPNGAGFIKFLGDGGRIIKIVSFKDYLLIFREHAIHRMLCHSNPHEFAVTRVFSTDQIIQAGSIAVADDRMFFVADTSLFSFDAFSARRIFSKVTALMVDTAEEVRGFFYKNKYYLSARFKQLDEGFVGYEILNFRGNNGLFYFDTASGETGMMRGVSIMGMTPVVYPNFSALFLNFGSYYRGYIGMLNDSGGFLEGGSQKLWRSPKTQFGRTNQIKILKRIYLTTLHDVDVTVYVDNEKKEFKVKGSPDVSLLPIKLAGKNIQIEFKTDDKVYDLHITNMVFEMDVGKRYNNAN
jgi:hypothetical protein